jgi:hypothetical protein
MLLLLPLAREELRRRARNVKYHENSPMFRRSMPSQECRMLVFAAKTPLLDQRRRWGRVGDRGTQDAPTMGTVRLALVIPALDEEASIGA